MITFDKINRRAHLYLGLFLMPWLLMYGVSSFMVIHNGWFPSDRPASEVLFEKAYSRPVNLQGANNSPELREAALEILKECNLEGAFWADKPKPDTLHIERLVFVDPLIAKFLRSSSSAPTEAPSSSFFRAVFEGNAVL